jgi:hypothetical protein
MGHAPAVRHRVLPQRRGVRGTMHDKEAAMPNMKETRDDAHPPARRNNTVTQQGENQAPKPQTPNERDESTHSQAGEAPSARRMGALAKQSVDRGERDTTKGAELDATYHRVHEESAPAPQDKRNRNQE